MVQKVKVSILKTCDPNTGVRKVIERSGHNLKIKGSDILIKPNLASAVPPDVAPQVTHPDIIGALIRYLREEGARKVYVGDEPSWGLGSRICFKKTGIKDAVLREGGKLIYFDEVKRIKRKITNGRIFQSISVPAILEEVDYIFNVPKIKTNLMTLVTLCIKNLFGFIPFKSRKKFHRGIDLSYALIDIAKVIKPDLNLLDGIIASEGMGAHSGTPYLLGLLMASTEALAADIIATQLMGFDPMEPITNQLGLKDKIGIEDVEQIQVVGEKLDKVKATFKRPIFHLIHPERNVEVIPGGICQGCIPRVPKVPQVVDSHKKYALIIGRRVRFPNHHEFDEIWCFGDCGVEECRKIAIKHPELTEKMKKVKGCPPLDWWKRRILNKEYRK